MSRVDEVEKTIISITRCAENYRVESNALQHQIRTLAAEMDERDEIITKLLEMLMPLPDEDPSPYWEGYCEYCGWFGLTSSCEEESPGESDTNVLCPECGNCVDELVGRHEGRIAATYTRACEIAGRTE